MTAPTEAEIREAIEVAFVENGTRNSAGVLSDGFADAQGALCAIFDHGLMRDREVERLHEIVGELLEPIEAEAVRRSREALIVGALRFVREHPDAPRKPQPVPA